jgi:DNA mismatch repair protein MutS2
MAIASQTLETLEYPAILAQLARHTAFALSRELALALTPSHDVVEIRRRLRLTREARRLLDEHNDATIGGARDIRGALGRARLGGSLDAPVFLDIAATLSSGRRLRGIILRGDPLTYPALRELAGELPVLPELEDRIARTVGEDGAVLDSASPVLGRLRAEVRIAYNRLHERLQSMLSSSLAEALQEPIITVRNGRYVVPVKAAQRRLIRGLVHDQSASGATLYIEPLATVELNNRWRELQLAEEQEVARVLAELSDVIGVHAVPLSRGLEAIGQLDLAFAQARYAATLDAVEPEIVTADELAAEAASGAPSRPPLQFRRARHPLIPRGAVVPIDLRLGGDTRLLLITGPNTGGKTVALKTTGLLVLMAQSGLYVPAAEPSRSPVFGQVFADIGDEQSIEQSLSTFSSHMTNIISILRALDASPTDDATVAAPPGPVPDGDQLERLANWRRVAPGEWAPLAPLHAEPLPALVLLDELGAGTDPLEGAALARAIIERLLDRDVLGVATTHYAELKAFAYATDGVVNGSVEFDLETLRPTYRLTIGLPGRSNALAIAERLGLDATLVARARSTLARDDAQVENLLAGIHAERATAAAERAAAEHERAAAEQERTQLRAERDAFAAERDAAWRAAQAEIEAQLSEARQQLRRLRDDFRSVTVSRQWLEEAEQRLQQTRERAGQLRPARQPAPPVSGPPAPRPLQAGDRVHVASVGLIGEVLAIDDEDAVADVQVGGFRMRVALQELQRDRGAGAPGDHGMGGRAVAATSAVALPPVPDAPLTLDMRGWRASDVPTRLEQYLNDAYLASLPFVRIIHGKGTGALRQVVREHLRRHPLVASATGGGADGGEGVTVAHLVDR